MTVKVAHFTTHISGGAGLYAYNIHRSLNGNNSISSRLYTREFSHDGYVCSFSPKSKFKIRLESILRLTLDYLGIVLSKYAALDIFKSRVDIEEIINDLELYNPDVIVFYWVSNFISFNDMLRISKKFKKSSIVLVCLDEAYLGGGCHYNWSCQKYLNGCVDCPISNFNLVKSKFRQENKLRKSVLKEIDPLVLVPTSQYMECARKSTILSVVSNVRCIPLGAVTKEERESVSIKRDNWPRKKKNIKLLVRSSSEKRKGCDLLLKALKALMNRKKNILTCFEFLIIGDDYLVKSGIGEYIKYEYLGFVDRKGLMQLYSEIDALCVSSLEDSGPIMINEAVSLGIYVLTTPVGVSSDLVNNDNGYVVKDFQVDSYAEGLEELINNLNINDKSLMKSDLTFYNNAMYILSESLRLNRYDNY